MQNIESKKTRDTQLFSSDWFFHYGEIPALQAFSKETDQYEIVNLPHDWSVTFPFDKDADTYGSGGYVKAGIGWYKKLFTLSDQAKNKKILLHFEGAYMCAKVWLNGKLLGEHVYGYTPFEFDITNDIMFNEENIITVKIDNSLQPNSRWYSGSGITRDVWITVLNHVNIPTNGTYITSTLNNGSADVKVMTIIEALEQYAGKTASLITRFYDSDNKLVAEQEKEILLQGKQEVEQNITVTEPKLWSDVTPYLYKAVSIIKLEGYELDEYSTSFGIRSICFDPDKGFLLNGVSTKINGFCIHHDGGSLGAAVPRKVWERRLKIMKAMGANGVRVSHNPPDTAVLDLCDELGFLVMDEAFDEWKYMKSKALGSNTHESKGYSLWFQNNHEGDIKDMLYRDRNHPSIILWSIGNEIPEQTDPQGHLLARKLKGICHSIDPTRPVTLANDQIEAEPRKVTDEFLNELDVVGYNYVGRWRERAETLYDTDKRKYPNRCIIGSENPSAGGKRSQYIFEPDGSFWSRPYYTVPVEVGRLLRYTMTHDYVAGDYMWTGIDYLGEAHWPNRSANCGVIDTCGFIKDNYYFYKSIWTKEPMIYAYPHWNLDIEEGKVIPVICYTNCEYAELYLDGKSYGKKSHSYPYYGMTERWGHMDKIRYVPSTDDMFLSWDVPYIKGEIEVIGYNDGKEACRYQMKTTKAPAKLRLVAEDEFLKADRRDITHVTVSVLDEDGLIVPSAENRITVTVEGAAKLIGIDNGDSKSYDLFKGNEMNALGGKILCILQAGEKAGKVQIKVTSEGLESDVLMIDIYETNEVREENYENI
jgi:beta-galactosidase